MRSSSSTTRRKATAVPTPQRDPEETISVYELGHYEQAHIEKALQMVVEDDEVDYDLLLSTIDADTIAGLLHIFASHGTVIIIRKDA
jgi:hypothetical protein